jgi:hypothetical protein
LDFGRGALGSVTGVDGGFESRSWKLAPGNEYFDIREVNSCEEAGGAADSSILRFLITAGERAAISSEISNTYFISLTETIQAK